MLQDDGSLAVHRVRQGFAAPGFVKRHSPTLIAQRFEILINNAAHA